MISDKLKDNGQIDAGALRRNSMRITSIDNFDGDAVKDHIARRRSSIIPLDVEFIVDIEDDVGEGDGEEAQAGKEKDNIFQKTKFWQSKVFWSSIDIYVPIIVTLPTLVSSLYLLIQAKSYTKPTYALWVVICIASGEASGAIFEMLRFYLKSQFSKSTTFRWDRFFNYVFTSLTALIYGVIFKFESVYWSRIWIVTLLPITGGLFRYALHHKWNDQLSNFLGTLMLFIEVYRITLIGAVLESTGYELGLFILLTPLLYVEVLWTTALCTFFQDFSSHVSGIMKDSIKITSSRVSILMKGSIKKNHIDDA